MYASPGNPTGTAYTEAEVRMLGDICAKVRTAPQAAERRRSSSLDATPSRRTPLLLRAVCWPPHATLLLRAAPRPRPMINN